MTWTAGSRHIAYWVHIEYWVQHFPQHHLSGSGIAQLEVYHCQEPGWGTPPVAKVMRKEARHTQRRDRASGVPLEILEHLPPKPESAYFTALCSHLHLWLYGGLSPTTSLWKRVNLQLQLIKLLGVIRVFQPTNSSEDYSGHMRLFTASQPWEAWDVLNCLNTGSFEQLKDWLEIVLVKGFSLVGQMFAAVSISLTYCVPHSVLINRVGV